MICHVCKKLDVRRLRIEKAVQIYECLDCQLGFVEQNVSSLTRSYKDDTNGFYDFEGYREKENKLKKRFGSLIEEIIKYKKEVFYIILTS